MNEVKVEDVFIIVDKDPSGIYYIVYAQAYAESEFSFERKLYPVRTFSSLDDAFALRDDMLDKVSNGFKFYKENCFIRGVSKE